MARPLLTPGCPDLGPTSFTSEAVALHCLNGKTAPQLRSEARRLCPRKPGVYGMIDVNGDLLYVGKAKNLRARVLSYFRRKRQRREARIIRRTSGIVWEVWPSEFAALLRELELIRRWRPRCNVAGQPLRRRMAFVCLGGAPAPHVYLTRRPGADALFRCGPVNAGPRAREAVRRVNDFFKLRDCPQPQEMIFAGDHELFPHERAAGCLRLEIGTCLGPCAAACSRTAYRERARAARGFLERRDDSPLTRLAGDMAAASAALAFERAASLRDQLDALRWLADRLDFVNEVRAKYSLVYAVRGHDGQRCWYLIHGGRTVAALPEPQTPAEYRAAAKLLRATYFKTATEKTLTTYEHADGVLLVASWFRRKPRERDRTMTPEAALQKCLEPQS